MQLHIVKKAMILTMFSRFYTFLFFFQFIFFLMIFSYFTSTVTAISYSDHCASIIPELSSTIQFHEIFPLLQIATTFYNGGEKILGKKSSYDEPMSYTRRSLSFHTTRNVYKTNHSDIYKIEAYLRLPTPHFRNLSKNSTSFHLSNYSSSTMRGEIKFLLNGYWSESSGKLCMVGSASSSKLMNLESVLKLDYSINKSTIFNSMVSGTLKSLSSVNDPSYFEPISIYAFPESLDYNYTLVKKEFDEDLPKEIDVPSGESLSLHPRSTCSMLSTFSMFELEYSIGCAIFKNCTPFDGSNTSLPTLMYMSAIQCSNNEQKLRYVMEFSNSSNIYDYYYHGSDVKATLIGEGSWDRRKNRLNIVACRILNSASPRENARVGNCSIMLTLRFPATWTIQNSTRIVGHLWANNTVNDSGFFNTIMVRSTDNTRSPDPGLKYEYTELEKVKRLCVVNETFKRSDKYPSARSPDMRFDMSIKESYREIAWGSAIPISVGAEFYEQSSINIFNSEGFEVVSEDQESTNENLPTNISYAMSFTPYPVIGKAKKLSFFNLSSGAQVEITAEGVYDPETGHLCMVGCRKLSSPTRKGKRSLDCEILVNFDFPPVKSRHGGLIKGSIASTRKSTDPLYFEVVNVTSNSFYMEEAKEFIWRLDFEIVMVLISSTLACFFIVLQIFYMKKHPEMLPSISITMLVILTLGYMIPLVLNFEAMFLENRRRRRMRYMMRNGWLEVNEVIVRVITLVAFLLVSRLLQLAWTSRSSDKKGSWIGEKKVLVITLPIYIVGGLAAILINWNTNSYQNGVIYDEQEQKHSLLGDLRSYGGLIVDGFLLPQILLNFFLSSRESVLSLGFYIGTTLVRLVPHGYDLYKIYNYSPYNFEGSYVYANPGGDLYSTAWDVIISCGGIFLAVIIYLQQRFGGRCVIPQRFRELDLYTKVPTTSGE